MSLYNWNRTKNNFIGAWFKSGVSKVRPGGHLLHLNWLRVALQEWNKCGPQHSVRCKWRLFIFNQFKMITDKLKIFLKLKTLAAELICFLKTTLIYSGTFLLPNLDLINLLNLIKNRKCFQNKEWPKSWFYLNWLHIVTFLPCNNMSHISGSFLRPTHPCPTTNWSS